MKAPSISNSVQISFTTDNTISGVLTADEEYRISSDADCIYALVHDPADGFGLTNGAFLAKGEVEYIEVDNRLVMMVVAAPATTSGLMTCNPLY